MKIAPRLTILLVVLTFIVALVVGWFAVDASTHSLYSTLDDQINAVIASGTGVRAYEWFGLRDGLTTATWTARFGILRDTYAPEPAFATLQHLITSHTARN